MTFLVVIIVLALAFDYINGFHDAANSIATIVSTKVLTPFQAVLWAAFFNFVAFYVFKDHAVANTIGKIVQGDFITLPVIFAGLIAAIIWNLLTWWYGIPSSSSHTLIGGFAGSALCHALITKGLMPLGDIIDNEKVILTVVFIFLAPVIGMSISMIFTLLTIQRNVWIKSAMLLAAAIGLWFLLVGFQKSKMKTSFAKLYQIEKLSEKAAIDPSMELELSLARKSLDIAYQEIENYEVVGNRKTARAIVLQSDLAFLENTLLDKKLKLFFALDQLKIKSDKDLKLKPVYDEAQLRYKTLKECIPLYHAHGAQYMIDSMEAMPRVLTASDKIGFEKAMSLDLEKELSKVLTKEDNVLIRYTLIGLLLLFIGAFIYNEKMRQPNALRTGNMYKSLQLVSSAAFSIGHGGSDAQKVMGIIAAALVANGDILEIKNMPNWVPIACYTAIGLGTLSGGWRIVKTMGTKITKVTPLEGVCAETAGAITLFLTAQAGIPVSTTHTITGSIMGVGATKRVSAVRWGVTLNLLWAWVLTIPISAILAAGVYVIVRLFL